MFIKIVSYNTLADYLNDSNLKHSLNEIAFRELAIKPKLFNEIVKKGDLFSNVDIKTASLYCGMDVYLTRKLSLLLRKRIIEPSATILSTKSSIK